MFRLHIDIPLFTDEKESADMAETLMETIISEFKFRYEGIDKLNYRLMSDEDRGAKNYLLKDALGHCTNNKCKVDL